MEILIKDQVLNFDLGIALKFITLTLDRLKSRPAQSIKLVLNSREHQKDCCESLLSIDDFTVLFIFFAVLKNQATKKMGST